jgi:hypothetical protein
MQLEIQKYRFHSIVSHGLASELGADSNTYLMVYNSNATIEGSYVVVLGNPE